MAREGYGSDLGFSSGPLGRFLILNGLVWGYAAVAGSVSVALGEVAAHGSFRVPEWAQVVPVVVMIIASSLLGERALQRYLRLHR